MKNLGNSVKYIGVDDLTTDLFESQFILPEGVSYNSYLILDEKVAILDTADSRFATEWLDGVEDALEGRTPDYLVIHHLEPDHSGMIVDVIAKWPEITIVASAKALKMLPDFMPEGMPQPKSLAVGEGSVLSLGVHNLRFFTAPMVHWPEVLMSLDSCDGALYSADAFGKFGALGNCGFYGSEDSDWSCEARRYYFNIVGKYGAPVRTLLGKLPLDEVKSVRPLHGPLLDTNLETYVSLYKTWSAYQPETEGIFIAVASIYGNTVDAACRLAEILRGKGAERVVVSDLCRSDMAENVEDAFRHSKMVLAASTYDGGVFTPMADFLHRLAEKGYSNRKVGIIENGSWAPLAGRVMKETLSTMKDVEVAPTVVTIRTKLKPSNDAALSALADELLQKA